MCLLRSLSTATDATVRLINTLCYLSSMLYLIGDICNIFYTYTIIIILDPAISGEALYN